MRALQHADSLKRNPTNSDEADSPENANPWFALQGCSEARKKKRSDADGGRGNPRGDYR